MADRQPIYWNTTDPNRPVMTVMSAGDTLSPELIRVSPEGDNRLTNDDGLYVGPVDASTIISQSAPNAIIEGADGGLLVVPGVHLDNLGDIISTNEGQYIKLGTDNKLLVQLPAGADLLSTQTGNDLTTGDDGKLYFNAQVNTRGKLAIDPNDKVLTQTEANGLLTNLNISYEVSTGILSLVGKNSEVLGTVNIETGSILDNVEVVVNPPGQPEGTYLAFTYTTASGQETVYVNTNEISASYTAGNAAININALTREISAVVDPASGLIINENGLAFGDDFQALTDEDKAKLDGIESGAQRNTVNSVNTKTGDVVLTKTDIGLGNVDNTSDANKPISNATQAALNAKQNTITGGITTGVTNNYTANRSLISDANGKVAVSTITVTELGYLTGLTANVQTQIGTINTTLGNQATLIGQKQNTITGAATTITTANLTASRVLISNASGKVAVSGITEAQLNFLSGATSNIQTQINATNTNVTNLTNSLSSAKVALLPLEFQPASGNVITAMIPPTANTIQIIAREGDAAVTAHTVNMKLTYAATNVNIPASGAVNITAYRSRAVTFSLLGTSTATKVSILLQINNA